MSMSTFKSAPLFAGILVAVFSPAASAAVDFAKEVAPILQTRCIECHGPDKQKAKLRLDTKADFLKGAKNGPTVKAGDAAGSEFHKRIVLPKDNDERMPPEGEPLTAEQITVIKDWINEGANWPDGFVVEAAKAKAPAAAADAGWVPPGPAKPAVPAPVRPKDFKPASAEAAALLALSKHNIEARPVAQGVPWREVNLRLLGSNVTDQVIAPLKDVTSLVEVRLGTTRVTDAGLAAIATLPHLEVLGLELTAVTDAGVAKLKGLSTLTSLNLYGTSVTDAALNELGGLKHLRNLYLWQTKVTPEGVKKLQAALPGLDINTGAELAAVATNAPAAKKDEAKK
jgi:mono/diheme cytochrome c family protein